MTYKLLSLSHALQMQEYYYRTGIRNKPLEDMMYLTIEELKKINEIKDIK